MCGIFAIIAKGCEGGQLTKTLHKQCQKCGGATSCKTVREVAYYHSGQQRHRGPDYTGIEHLVSDGVVMVHERLSIVGVKYGNQPLVTGDIVLVANGEIYNYVEVAKQIMEKRDKVYEPRSDCDVIIALYEEYGLAMMDHFTGMFAFVLYDRTRKRFVAGRDPFGIIPMYHGTDAAGNRFFASEMKCLVGLCTQVESFEPGVFWWAEGDEEVQKKRFFQPDWFDRVPQSSVSLPSLRHSLEQAVHSHLQCEVNFGALLSGGVDSSLIAAIATRIRRKTDPEFRLKTFSVGLKNAPDFKYSQMVAQFIDSDHEEVVITVEQGLDCIRDIIYHLESYDVTTIRASECLLSRVIMIIDP